MPERVAVVTGAASGIGRATAARLASDGWAVVGIDVDSRVQEADHGGGGYRGFLADVRDAALAKEIVAETIETFGRIDALVAAAGIERDGPLEDQDPSDWDLVIDTCLKGTLAYCAATVPHLRSSGDGGIVTFGSVLGRAALPGCGVYAAAKAGLEALTRALALDFAPSVRVNCVVPGTTDTPLCWQSVPEGELAQAKRLAAGEIPLGFVADPADIANIVAFLLSTEARFVTGQSIVADGGTLAKIASSY
ncbi:MAG: short-chain dehydrogenase/reductase [Acidimicrobiaceae bacterium]|nr:short-chain dehydrogenase/reductase [Acidimicrobiaceae bacterium]